MPQAPSQYEFGSPVRLEQAVRRLGKETGSETVVLPLAWIQSPNAEPEPDMTLVVQRNVLTEIRPSTAVEASRQWPVVWLPPLANAHTHLEFSSLQAPLSPFLPFSDWIRNVVQYRRANPHTVADSIRAGIRESWLGGASLIGEISTSSPDLDWFSLPAECGPFAEDPTPLTVISFRELLAPLPEMSETQLAVAAQHLQSIQNGIVDRATFRAGRIIPGISPHAPYTTNGDLVAEAARLAADYQVPLTMHVAETTEELAFLQTRTGPLAEMMSGLNLLSKAAWPTGASPRDVLDRLTAAPQALIVHGNYLTESELRFMAAHDGMSLVYCPRTHAAFGHEPHPWSLARELGVRVILGTDGRSSNPDLAMWSELAAFLRRSGEPLRTALPLVTDSVYEAVGLPSPGGSLEEGQPAEGILVPVDCVPMNRSR